MQTTEKALAKFAKALKKHGHAPITQTHYLRFARMFLEWSNCNNYELTEEKVNYYLKHLADVQKLSPSTINTRKAAIRLLVSTITNGKQLHVRLRRKLVKNGHLKEDRLLFVQHLEEMGYSKESLRNFKWTIRCLDQFMLETGHSKYSSSVGETFLSAATASGRHTESVLFMMQAVVRRFNWYKEGGEFVITMPRISRECPLQFIENFVKYLEAIRLKGLRESTIENHRYNIHKALLKFDGAGVKNYSEITPEIIYTVFEKTSHKTGFCSPVRGFLSYLFGLGVIPLDYSVVIPSVRKAQPAPSIYTVNETEALLDTCAGNNNADKRDIAVMLLALRLGIRAGDIANLKISDIDYEAKEICFVQKKTWIPQRLELLPEIEAAVKAYISSSRPDSKFPNVFLSLKPPFRPITTKSTYNIVSHRFHAAGIETKERKQGGHALRMTFASELVAEKVPYDAVRKILGHEDPVSIKHYVKFDIEPLRSCAIKVPMPTGKLAAYMESRIGGELQ
jgi:site-specific recombinase XerD